MQEVKDIIINKAYYYTFDLNPRLFNIFKKQFTYPNKLYYMEMNIHGKSKQDKYIATFNELYDKEKDLYKVFLLRGEIDNLKMFLKNNNLSYKIVDNTYTQDFKCNISGKLFTLGYQMETVKRIIKHKDGLVVAPPGSGKTISALKFIAEVQQTALIIVPSKFLVKQWRDAIKKVLNIDCGIYTGSVKEFREITVATSKSMYNYVKDNPIAQQFGILIVDEAHHIPSQTLFYIVNAFKSKYKIGLSATPYRKDMLDLLIYTSLGKIIYEVSSDDLKNENRFIKTNVNLILMPYIMSDYLSGKNYNDLLKFLFNNDDYFNYLVKFLKSVENEALVVFPRVDFSEKIYNKLKKYRNTIILNGKNNLPPEKVNKDKPDIIIGTTQYLYEGLDFPYLKNIVIPYPINNKQIMTQLIGRIQRFIPNKNEINIYEFYMKNSYWEYVVKVHTNYYIKRNFNINRVK